jgi:hypothetical protein
MSGDGRFPTSPEQLTNRWLSEVLAAGPADSGVTVACYRSTPVDAQGASAIVTRVAIEYDGPHEGLPDSVVIKFATPHAPMRAVMHRFGLYRTEVEFYRQLSRDAGIPTPQCYAADIDDDSGHFVLVLEDMAPARGGDPLVPRTDDVEMAIPHLARFHARWWAHPQLRSFGWLRYPESEAYRTWVAATQPAFAGALGVVRQRLGGAFPAVLVEAGERMVAHWADYMASRQTSTPTLQHRDFHGQQIFYPSQQGGRFAVFDWQTLAIGRGVEDLSRLLSTGLTTGDRRAHDRRFVERYHAELVAAGVTGYELDQCRDEFRLGLTASLITNIIASATLDAAQFAARESAAGVSLAYVLFDRLAAAFEAHDVVAALPAR